MHEFAWIDSCLVDHFDCGTSWTKQGKRGAFEQLQDTAGPLDWSPLLKTRRFEWSIAQNGLIWAVSFVGGLFWGGVHGETQPPC